MADERRVTLSGQRLVGADFSGTALEGFYSIGCSFNQCRFDEMMIESASFGAGRTVSEYVGCTFDGAKMYMGPGGYARFIDCSFANADLSHWACYAVEIVRCSFSGNIHNMLFSGQVPAEERQYLNRESNRFEGNDFAGARLSMVHFQNNVDLSKQRLPEGDDYLYLPDACGVLRAALKASGNWNNTAEKNEVEPVLGRILNEAFKNQSQILVHFGDYSESQQAALRKIFAEIGVL